MRRVNIMRRENYRFCKLEQVTINHTPVHIVVIIDKHLPLFNQLLLQTCTKTFLTEECQTNRTSPQNDLLNMILGLSELFSSTGTNAMVQS